MKSRRDFLKLTALSTAFISFNKSFGKNNFYPGNETKPIVISTWKHGVEANADAWKVLSAGGRALDAVEKGVMNTENDLQNLSVGLGGLPDRDGHEIL